MVDGLCGSEVSDYELGSAGGYGLFNISFEAKSEVGGMK